MKTSLFFFMSGIRFILSRVDEVAVIILIIGEDEYMILKINENSVNLIDQGWPDFFSHKSNLKILSLMQPKFEDSLFGAGLINLNSE